LTLSDAAGQGGGKGKKKPQTAKGDDDQDASGSQSQHQEIPSEPSEEEISSQEELQLLEMTVRFWNLELGMRGQRHCTARADASGLSLICQRSRCKPALALTLTLALALAQPGGALTSSLSLSLSHVLVRCALLPRF